MASARTFARHRIALALLAGLPGAPLLAGEPAPPPASPAKEGEIVYARDVHHSIGAQHFPGRSHAAVTAPTGAIVAAVALGLAPLTEGESAAVTGSAPQTIIAQSMARIESLAGAQGGGSPGAGLLATQGAAHSAGGTIASGMAALSDALSSLSVIGGGRP